MRLAVLCAIGAASCFSPSPQPGGTCVEGGLCPAPLACDPATNTCVIPGAESDASLADAEGCEPTPEICDGVDQDCDDEIDDDFPALGDDCTVGVGACQADGTYECNSGGTDVVCTAQSGGPAAEICDDGIDQDCDTVDPPCPVNDAPAGAIDLSAGGAFTAELAVARDDAEGSCGAPGGRDLFYEITVPADEVVYLDSFGSDFDVVVRIHAGACAQPLGTEFGCVDDACGGSQVQSAGVLVAGTSCIVVDQAAGASEVSGHVDLRVIRGRRPGIELVGTSGTMVGSTVGGANLAVPICEGDSTTAPDVGYFFTVCPDTTVVVAADTCESTLYDSWLSIRRDDGRTGPELACLDDGCGVGGDDAMISQSITGAGLYWILVDGWGADAGAFEMDYSIQ